MRGGRLRWGIVASATARVIGKLGKLESIGHVEARVTVGTINRTVLSVAGNE